MMSIEKVEEGQVVVALARAFVIVFLHVFLDVPVISPSSQKHLFVFQNTQKESVEHLFLAITIPRGSVFYASRMAPSAG